MSDLRFNLAQLLREPVGAIRDYTFDDERLELDENLTLQHPHGEVRFTRTPDGVMARIHILGSVRLTCVRSLEEFDQPIDLKIDEQMYAIVDVLTSVRLPKPDEDDAFLLSDTHMADIGNVIREYVLLDLPLKPVSPAWRDKPVAYTVDSEGEDPASASDEKVDARLAVLKKLIDPSA